MNLLHQKIKELRLALGLTQDELARKVGYTSRSTIAKIESGAVDLSQSKIQEFAKVLKTTPAYLTGWDENNVSPGPVEEQEEALVKFPVIGSISAGYGGIAVEEYTEEYESIPSSSLRGHSPGDYFVLEVKGNSMYPLFLEGDRVLVRRCSSVENGTIAAVLYGDCATLKKVRYLQGQACLELIPINPEYQVKRIENEELEQCRILGKIVRQMRRF